MSNVTEVRIPQENVNDERVAILGWHVADGGRVETDQLLVEIETSKATFEIRSPVPGVLKILAPKGSEPRVGEALCCIGPDFAAIEAHVAKAGSLQTTSIATVSMSAPPVDPGHSAKRQPMDASAVAASAVAPVSSRRFSRRALDLLRAHGLKEQDVPGSGLIREEDVLSWLGEPKSHESVQSVRKPDDAEASSLPVYSAVPVRTDRCNGASDWSLASWVKALEIRCAVSSWLPRKLTA